MALRSGMTQFLGTLLGKLSSRPNPVSIVTRLVTGTPLGGGKMVSFWFTRRNSKVLNSYFFQSGPPRNVSCPGVISHARSALATVIVLSEPCGRMRISLEVVLGM